MSPISIGHSSSVHTTNRFNWMFAHAHTHNPIRIERMPMHVQTWTLNRNHKYYSKCSAGGTHKYLDVGKTECTQHTTIHHTTLQQKCTHLRQDITRVDCAIAISVIWWVDRDKITKSNGCFFFFNYIFRFVYIFAQIGHAEMNVICSYFWQTK